MNEFEDKYINFTFREFRQVPKKQRTGSPTFSQDMDFDISTNMFKHRLKKDLHVIYWRFVYHVEILSISICMAPAIVKSFSFTK